MKKTFTSKYPLVFLAVMIIGFILVNFSGSRQDNTRIIDGDGSGLYAYLPAILIYGSVDFTPVYEFEKNRRSSDYQGHYFNKVGEVLINKFSSGTALLMTPFFLLAWLASLIFGFNPDGYNIFFQFGVAFSAFFWVLIGLVYLVKLAGLHSVKKETSILLALAGLLGTNLFYYTFLAPAASHAYSFSIVTIFLYYTKLTFLNYSRKSVYLAAFSLGILVLIRPVNILVIAAIPFLASTQQSFFATIKEKIRTRDFLIAPLIFIAALLPQLLINFLQTGQLFIFGYTNEGFYFDKPKIINLLFSYRKGWFVYTPMMLLVIPGIVYLRKRSVFELISFTSFMVILVYVFSSWWNWLYGDSFGMRPMVDFYGLSLLIIALFVQSLRNKWIKLICWSFVGLTILLNLIQTYQYSKGILHPDSMNKSAYWHVFLKTSDQYIGDIADTDEYFYGTLSDQPLFETGNDLEKAVEGWTAGPGQKEYRHSGVTGNRLDEKNHFSASYTFHIPDPLENLRNLYLIFESQYLEPEQNAALGALFVVDIRDLKGRTVFYKAFRLKRLPDKKTGEWRLGSIGFKLPVLIEDKATVKLYIWNKDKQTFYIDDLHIELFTYQN